MQKQLHLTSQEKTKSLDTTKVNNKIIHHKKETTNTINNGHHKKTPTLVDIARTQH